MDGSRFDGWTRVLAAAGSRRRILVAVAFWVTGLSLPGQTATAGPRCENVGNRCDKGKDCCSGVCKGKKGRKRCKAHDTGGCRPEQDLCAGDIVSCTSTTGAQGNCLRTTGNAGYCGNGSCFDCKRDADCRGLFGPRAACVVCDNCAPLATACAGPDEL